MENTFVVQPTLSTVKGTCGYERDQWACCEWGADPFSAVKSTCGACCEWGADPFCCQEHLWLRA